jgi:hypothetical protein
MALKVKGTNKNKKQETKGIILPLEISFVLV